MEQSSLLQIQKLAHRVLFGLLRLLPPAILYPRKCPQFRLVSKQHDFADDVAVPHSDGLSMYFRNFTGGGDENSIQWSTARAHPPISPMTCALVKLNFNRTNEKTDTLSLK